MERVRLAKSKKYKEENFKPIIEKSLSIAGVCRELGIRPVGGNYKTIHYFIDLYDIDTTHFTGQGWNVGTMYRPIKSPLSLNDILVENSTYTNTSSLKKKILNNNILEYVCVGCGVKEWKGEELTLQLDHINGNNRDNRLDNLRLLCPNCHSQTTTYCNRNNVSNIQEYKKDLHEKYKVIIKEKENNITRCIDCNCRVGVNSVRCKKCHNNWLVENSILNYCECGKKIKKGSIHCIDCVKIKKRKQDRPPYIQLLNEIKNTNKSRVSEKYNITRSTLNKWLSFYEKGV